MSGLRWNVPSWLEATGAARDEQDHLLHGVRLRCGIARRVEMTTVPSLAQGLERQVRAHATVLSRDVRIVRAGLGDSSAIFGAADRVWGQR